MKKADKKEILRTPISEDVFLVVNKEWVPMLVEAYNDAPDNKAKIEALRALSAECLLPHRPLEFANMANIMLFAYEGLGEKTPVKTWELCAGAAMQRKDYSFAREIAQRALNDGDCQAAGYFRFILENVEDEPLDILGMITDELLEKKELADEDYWNIVQIAEFCEMWRELPFPKCACEKGYDIIHRIVMECVKIGAYRTALRLIPVDFAADEKANRYAYIYRRAGNCFYELGQLEAAKRCFMGAKLLGMKLEDEYAAKLLDKDTKLEITDEVFECQQKIDENIALGKFRTYNEAEFKQILSGERNFELYDFEEEEAARYALGEKVLDEYEKQQAAGVTGHNAINAALKLLPEKHELYPQAGFLYYMKANLYFEKNNIEKALETIKTAYKCEGGNRNTLVLLSFGIFYSMMKRFGKTPMYGASKVYVVRAYFIGGMEIIERKLGPEAVEEVKQYIGKGE